ncbi:MAG TPA: hypothetical protein VK779_10320 [Rhizomicrobium sp.]|jgi:hypothetical protein|nr:hypothetical protein [Rhizomicrobium sp.]
MAGKIILAQHYCTRGKTALLRRNKLAWRKSEPFAMRRHETKGRQ